MKKIILIMLMLLLSVGFVACNREEVSKSESDTDISDSGEASEWGGKAAIVYNGEAVYSVVYPKTATSRMKKAANSLASQIRNQTGVTIEVKSEDGSDGNYILIGKTRYQESNTVIEELGHKDYSIVKVDNKIVITGKMDDYTLEAIDYFIDELIEENVEIGENGKRTLWFEEYKYKEEVLKMTVNGINIEKYKIIYASAPSGMADIANKLKDSIYEQYGVTLEVGKDTTNSETEYEILLGATNRQASKAYYSTNKQNIMKYKLSVKDSKMLFLCGGAYSCGKLVEQFGSEYFVSGNSKIVDGEYLNTNLLDVESTRITSGSDLRVMTSNILNQEWVFDETYAHYDIPTEVRAEIYAGVLLSYRPDLIGVQETSKKWQQLFPYYLDVLKNDYGIEYTWILKEQSYGSRTGVNHTSIMYRSDKYTLVESGIKHFSYATTEAPSKLTIRLVAHAVFKDSSGQKYALFNTHFDGNDGGVDRGVISSNETAARITEIIAPYGDIPVFCTGDFNFHVNGAYNYFKTASGLLPSVEAARANGTLENEFSGIGSSMYIDHVHINSKVNIMRYETIVANCTEDLSDHRPQYGDYKIK